MSSTALWVASPRMVLPKLLLPMSTAPPPPPPPPPPAPRSEVPPREDSPVPVTAEMISPVLTLTIRAETATMAFEFLVPMPLALAFATRKPPPPMLVFLSSRPNWVMLPMTNVSTPRSWPILAALVGLARSLLEKFCSARSLSSAARSMTEYWPSLTSFSMSIAEMPLPMSWSVPKMAETEDWTVP